MEERLTIDFPYDLKVALEAAGFSKQLLQKEVLHQLAAVLYMRKVLSLEQASHLSGMNLWEFIPFLDKLGIVVADYDKEETQKEMESVKWLTNQKL
ncbi:MAG: UPF0175 family protein [Bacteroidetes bacterium]|nr:UPF0175 family protein [Bacteroidota bacterium]